jgi:hypothetical protein
MFWHISLRCDRGKMITQRAIAQSLNHPGHSGNFSSSLSTNKYIYLLTFGDRLKYNDNEKKFAPFEKIIFRQRF